MLKQQFRNLNLGFHHCLRPTASRSPATRRAPPPGRGGTLASGSETLPLDGLGLRGSGILSVPQTTYCHSVIYLPLHPQFKFLEGSQLCRSVLSGNPTVWLQGTFQSTKQLPTFPLCVFLSFANQLNMPIPLFPRHQTLSPDAQSAHTHGQIPFRQC